MLKTLEPSNALEEEHALQIISLGWRLRRHSSVEAGLYNQEMIQQMKNGTNRLEVTLLKRRDFEEMVIELDKVPEYQGIAFRRDCKTDNAQIKLNTIYVRNLSCYHKLLDSYFERKNWTKDKKIH
jgi:hypothetical protein